MAFGIGEDPALSVTTHLEQVDYPVWREQLVKSAMDGGAPPDVINVLKSLPQSRYETRQQVLRDLSEAARRFAMGGMHDDDGVSRDRRNIGRDAVQGRQP